MSKVTPSRQSVVALDQVMIVGVDKHYANVPSVVLGGASYAPADLKGILQGEIDLESEIEAARAKVRQLLGTARTTRTKARSIRRLIKALVLTTFGPDAAQMLADFGVKLKNPSTPKVEAKVEAKVKRQATRKARHTMGSKQKQSVKGQVPETPATPKPV